MPINLAGGYAAGGLHDALLEIVKQRMLEQELAQRAEENQFQRLRQNRLDESAASERTYQHGRDTAGDIRQKELDRQAEEARQQQQAIGRFNILKGQSNADITASLGEDPTTAHVVPTATPANIPGATQAYRLPAVPMQPNRMDIGGVKIRPPSAEILNEEAAADEKRKQDIAVEQAARLEGQKPPKYDVSNLIWKKDGLPVAQDAKTNKFYRGSQEVPANEVAYKPPERDPGAADARDLARLDRSFYNAKATLDKTRSPIAQQAERLDRVVTSINQNSPQADALIAPELLTAMAGGQGSGLRMNEAEISRIVGGRTNWESLKAAANKWYLDPSKGLSITPAQRLQIRALTTDMQKKVLGRLDALDRSDEELRSADSVEEHRRIVSEAQKALTDSARPEAGGPTNQTGTLPPLSQRVVGKTEAVINGKPMVWGAGGWVPK